MKINLPTVSLRFSLADEPRTHVKDWLEDLSAKASGICSQWDPTGAITLIADAAYWNAMPGHITTAATPGDFSPPAALAATATPVELTTWRLEMDMYFDHTMAS